MLPVSFLANYHAIHKSQELFTFEHRDLSKEQGANERTKKLRCISTTCTVCQGIGGYFSKPLWLTSFDITIVAGLQVLTSGRDCAAYNYTREPSPALRLDSSGNCASRSRSWQVSLDRLMRSRRLITLAKRRFHRNLLKIRALTCTTTLTSYATLSQFELSRKKSWRKHK